MSLPIFRSQAQARLLTELYLVNPHDPTSLSGLSERTGIALSTVQREVERLEEAGLVTSTRIGSARFVCPNEASPYFDDLHSLVLKAFGPTRLLALLLARVEGVHEAFIFGSWARRYRGERGGAPRDIDLLVVGDAPPEAVYKAAREAENSLNLEVNPVLAAREEWQNPQGLLRRIKDGPFVELELRDGAEEVDR